MWKCSSSALGSARPSSQELETLGQPPQVGKQPFLPRCIEQILSSSVSVKTHERLQVQQGFNASFSMKGGKLSAPVFRRQREARETVTCTRTRTGRARFKPDGLAQGPSS